MRFKDFINNKRSVAFSFLISYAVMLLVPSITMLAVYFNMLGVVKQQFEDANINYAKQFAQTIDNQLVNIEKLSLQISSDENLKSIVFMHDYYGINEQQKITKFSETLNTYSMANKFVDEIFVYVKNQGIVIATKGVTSLEDFYNQRFKNTDLDYNEYAYLFEKSQNKSYKALTLTNDDVRKHAVLFTQAYAVSNLSNPECLIGVVFDDAKIGDFISQIKIDNGGWFYIQDKNKTPVYSTLEQKINIEPGQKSDIEFRTINGERVQIAYMSSNIADWYYFSIIPVSVFMTGINTVHKVMGGSIAITLIVGVFLIYVFTKMNYAPILDITKSINDSGVVGNELDYIKETITSTIEKLDKVDRQIEHNQNIVKNSFLLQALNGKLPSDISFEEECKNFGIEFASNNFAIMLIHIEEYSNLFFEGSKKDEEYLGIVQFIINNIVSELLSKNNICYMVDYHDMMIALLNIKDENLPTTKDELIRTAQEAQSFIKKEFGIYFSCAISNVYQGYKGILACYKEVLQIYEYAYILGKKNYIYHYSNVEFSASNVINGNNTSFEEQQFANCLRVNDFEKAREILKGIFENNFLNSVQSIQMIKGRMFGLINAMINVINDMNLDDKSMFLQKLNLTERLFTCETVIDLQNEMLSLIDEIDRYTQEKKQLNCTQIRDEIINFIKENYFRHDLSVSMIADEFNMNASYLSKFFRKHVGEGLLNYIHTVRIESSKKYLEDKRYSIKEIAEMVGFYNSDAYIRTFKKVMGITPGKYRELNKV